MKNFFKSLVTNFLNVIFPEGSIYDNLDSEKKIPVKYTNVSEEVLSDICVANTKEKLHSVGIDDPESDEAVEYLSKDKMIYPVTPDMAFEKKVFTDLAKKEKKRRNLFYKLHTTSGIVIFEGRHLKTFLSKTKLILPFNYKSAYRFADKYGKEKVFKDKYLISFEEVVELKKVK